MNLSQTPGRHSIAASVSCSDEQLHLVEFGAGDPAQGVTALSAWITANPATVYSYLLPLFWDAEPTFITFARLYTSQNAETYFYLPVSSATWATYTGVKSVVMIAISPNAASTEFPAANVFAIPLNFSPSVINKVPTGAYQFLGARLSLDVWTSK